MAAISLSEDALNHLKELPSKISQIDLPKRSYTVSFVCLSGDRLYIAVDWALFVYSMSDHTSLIATYQLGSFCPSGIITDNHLYLGGDKKLHLFEITT
jgi:hypothetical protein